MEKASKILMFVFFLGAAYLAWSIFIYSPGMDDISNRLAIEGKSMEPTFHDGQLVKYSGTIIPKAGDVVYFTKNSTSDCEGPLCNKNKDSELIKRIASMHDNCYYLLGDNPDHSWDSRNFGELCGNQITIHGVVTNQ